MTTEITGHHKLPISLSLCWEWVVSYCYEWCRLCCAGLAPGTVSFLVHQESEAWWLQCASLTLSLSTTFFPWSNFHPKIYFREVLKSSNQKHAFILTSFFASNQYSISFQCRQDQNSRCIFWQLCSTLTNERRQKKVINPATYCMSYNNGTR